VKEALIALWLASAADLGTTEYALANYAGAQELNPLQRNQAVRIGTHIALPLFLTYEARKNPKSKRLKILIWAGACVLSAAATNNAVVMIRVGS
jgi:hypothetical protein